ncbi:MAG TPA: hypothetical protein HPP97_14880 [Desulfuromonadales bacterium]|nr:hypothetical protein [Desulfuromonadales bacterium]
MKLNQLVTVALFMTLPLVGGCGGGDDGVVVIPEIKGFWSDAAGANSAIVLANGDSWTMSLNSGGAVTSFSRLQSTKTGTSFSSVGTRYLLQTGTTEAATAAGTFKPKLTLTGKLTTASESIDFVFAYNTRYDTPALLADAVGSWTGTFNNGTSSRTMNIATNGALTGTSTTGCSYLGTVSPRSADPAVFDVNYTETCVVGAPTILNGIATLNGAKTGISIPATTIDKSSGALFVGQKNML